MLLVCVPEPETQETQNSGKLNAVTQSESESTDSDSRHEGTLLRINRGCSTTEVSERICSALAGDEVVLCGVQRGRPPAHRPETTNARAHKKGRIGPLHESGLRMPTSVLSKSNAAAVHTVWYKKKPHLMELRISYCEFRDMRVCVVCILVCGVSIYVHAD
jgi:hypothetical protein